MNTPKSEEIISVENLLLAWKEFLAGKKKRKDVQEFQLHLMDNILSLHQDLKNKAYRHGGYHAFNISDPKPRNIHKATVRDRLLHHAIYRILYPYFDAKFIFDSYSCRKWKGTHRALDRFREFGRKVSANNTKTAWVLKCDIRKFFASIDQKILIEILKSHRLDADTIWLLERVIKSFSSNHIYAMADMWKGLPLGNLTSQLLVNAYMDWFDQWVKHRLRARYYIRYADDFVIMNTDKSVLEESLVQVQFFLKDNLALELHPNKISITTLFSGVDFLGWVHFPHHRVLRTVAKRRMFKNLKINPKKETFTSYLGLLKHGNTYLLQQPIAKYYAQSG
ncbi:MAG: group II intron reverse transcriptase domain-containing protein [Candidatus Zambryskibacteria bacterium]|nr:group II intron reverse transcriptase domain-containing protein [Candidatus Zambryskibacteria bacterium]